MTTTLIATYANGVFKPKTPVDLPENAEVELTLKSANGAATAKPAPGSPAAWETYIRQLKASTYHFGNRFDRDALYDDCI